MSTEIFISQTFSNFTLYALSEDEHLDHCSLDYGYSNSMRKCECQVSNDHDDFVVIELSQKCIWKST